MQQPGFDPETEKVSSRAWGLLIFLTLLNVLNFVDRSLVSILAPLLMADLGLSRAQIGLLAGFGFVFFYTLVGLFLGIAADRWRRIPLLAAGLALWSAMTAISGLARNFLHLAIPRIFVGVGEATLTPSALSMLGDVFPARRLATATGIYYAGIPIGTAVSMIAASLIAPRYGWRSCFYILGIAGLVAVFILLLFREPTRREVKTAAAAAPRQSFGQLARDMFRALVVNKSLALTLLGGSLLCYGAGAALLAVTWLVEDRGYTYQNALIYAGLIAAPAGFVGNLAGGAFGDFWARRRANGHLFSLIPMTLFFVPCSLAFYYQTPGTPVFFVCWFITAAGTSAWFGPLFAAIQELSPAHTRASAVALALLVLNLLGVGPGPLITGMLGDRYDLTHGLLASQLVVVLAIIPFAIAILRDRPSQQPT
jgi:MFS family permease